MQKRGQVTIFIVVGILVVAIAGIIFFAVSSSKTSEIKAGAESSIVGQDISASIRGFIESCMHERAIEAIDVAARHGGVIMYGDDTLVTDTTFLQYAYRNGITKLDYDTSAEHLAFYIDLSLQGCINDFANFAAQGLLVEQLGASEAHHVDFLHVYSLLPSDFTSHSVVEITESQVLVQTSMPIRVVQGNDEIRLDNFRVEVDSQLGEAIADTQKFAQEFSEQGLVDFENLFGVEGEASVHRVNDETGVFSLYYGDGVPVYFASAVEVTGNRAPVIEIAQMAEVKAGKAFTLFFEYSDPDGDAVTLSSPGFLATADGNLTGVVAAGEHEVVIVAQDSRGLSTERMVRIVAK